MSEVKGKVICKFPSKPATSKQTWAIKCISGEDVRDSNLTRAEASTIIQNLNSKGDCYLPDGKTYTTRSGDVEKFICSKKALRETANKLWEKNGRVNPMTVGAVVKNKKKRSKVKKSSSWAMDLCSKAEEAGQKAMDELIASNSVPAMVVQQHANVLDDSSEVTEQWVVPGGPCGFAAIRVKCTNGPSRKFINQLKKAGLAGDQNCFKDWSKSDYYGGYMKSFTLIGGQSLAYKTAYANAYAKVLEAEEIDTWVWTKMD